MAESVQASTDPKVAADVIASEAYQRVKIGAGADGSATDVSQTNPLPAEPRATASGGGSAHRKTSAATNNATSVKGAEGTLTAIEATNVGTGTVYLKLYNKATAPAPATDNASLVMVIPLLKEAKMPPLSLPLGVLFPLGIAYAIVKGATDTNNESVEAEKVFLNLAYK